MSFLSLPDVYLRPAASDALPAKTYTLSGPGPKAQAAALPVRGDLAHIKLAGQCFVPHYAVPMPHVAMAGGAVLRALGRADAAVIAHLIAGAGFDVLDMAGGWAWGQCAGAVDEGLVGYVLLAELAGAGQ